MCHYKWPKPHKQSARLIGTRCQNGKKGKTKKRRGRSPACRLLWLYIWNEGECFFVFFYGTGHLWIGDPGILRHVIGSHLCSVPPLQAAAQKSHQAAAVRGKAFLTADLLSPARLSTGPVWTTIPTPSLQLRRADTVCVRQWRGGDLGGEWREVGVGVGCRFLCYCLVLKGEEPVVDSTLARREGAVQRGKIPFT